jgi:mono/diheme cytochrome c family protein
MPRTFVPAAVAAVIVGWAALLSAQRSSAPVVLPDGPGKELVTARCSQCHALNMITGSGGYTREGWTQLLQSMTKTEPAETRHMVATPEGHLALACSGVNRVALVEVK